MDLRDVTIDPKSVGNHLILTSVSKVYEYRDGKSTDTVVGYRYRVVLPDHGYSPLSVKIEGDQQIEHTGANIEVTFEGLELYIYWLRGTYNVGARATAIHEVQSKA